MQPIFTILLVIIFQLCFAQADSITIAKEIKADKITKRTVRGKYVYQTSHGRIFLKVRPSKHFRWRGINSFYWTISRGKWKIQNDTLILTEKFYRKEPFTKRVKVDTATSRFIMSNGTLHQLDSKTGQKTHIDYQPIKAWRKHWKKKRRRRCPWQQGKSYNPLHFTFRQ